MAAIGNFIWIVFGGFLYAIFWGVLAVLFHWTKPLSNGFLEIAKFCFLPFGKEVIKQTELDGKNCFTAEEQAKIDKINKIWLPFGILAAIFTLLSGVLVILTGLILVVTIIFASIGLLYFPIGVAFFKITGVVFQPAGVKTVSKKQAMASAVVNEMERRKALEN